MLLRKINNMFKAAFFISLKRNQTRILKGNIDKGNPGIGGTQYLYLITVKCLQQLFGSENIFLLTDTNIDKCGIKSTFCENVLDAARFCENNFVPNLVINNNELNNHNLDFLLSKINFFIWAHNTVNLRNQKIIYKYESIKKVICVSQKQYENMLDTRCFEKCTFINNVITEDFFNSCLRTNYISHDVYYVGNILPQKGLHNLLDIWKYVEKMIPDAKLHIIGDSKVWNSNNDLGKLNISDIFYEKVLLKKLRRIKNKENIIFHHGMKWEDINGLLVNARVGVVNPSYYLRDETFCLSAIELQAHGLPIVSRNRNDGLSTSIDHEVCGYLEKSDKRIAQRISQLLLDNDLCKKMGEAAIKNAEKYCLMKEIYKWRDLFENKTMKNEKKHKIFFLKDSFLLKIDVLRRYMYVISSGKFFSKIMKGQKND